MSLYIIRDSYEKLMEATNDLQSWMRINRYVAFLSSDFLHRRRKGTDDVWARCIQFLCSRTVTR